MHTASGAPGFRGPMHRPPFLSVIIIFFLLGDIFIFIFIFHFRHGVRGHKKRSKGARGGRDGGFTQKSLKFILEKKKRKEKKRLMAAGEGEVQTTALSGSGFPRTSAAPWRRRRARDAHAHGDVGTDSVLRTTRRDLLCLAWEKITGLRSVVRRASGRDFRAKGGGGKGGAWLYSRRRWDLGSTGVSYVEGVDKLGSEIIHKTPQHNTTQHNTGGGGGGGKGDSKPPPPSTPRRAAVNHLHPPAAHYLVSCLGTGLLPPAPHPPACRFGLPRRPGGRLAAARERVDRTRSRARMVQQNRRPLSYPHG